MASSALSKELLEPELLYQFEPKKWAEKIEYNSTQNFNPWIKYSMAKEKHGGFI